MVYEIYLVEDDIPLNKLLTAYLQKEEWRVKSFFNGEKARQEINNRPHLWILDILLPGYNGYQLLRRIKEDSPEVPVIFISSRDKDFDRIQGLEIGGEDYISKPFLPRELVLRTSKLLARVYQVRTVLNDNPFVLIPPYTINRQNREVFNGNQPLVLTAREFNFLLYFIDNSGQIITRDQIIQHVWGAEDCTNRVVDNMVYKIRKKMPELSLKANYGYGYILAEK